MGNLREQILAKPVVNDDQLRNRRVTVAGLGHFGGGIAVARWLVSKGARVLVTDKETPERLADSVAQLSGLPIEFHLGGHAERDFTDTDLLVISPALKPANPFLMAARSANVPVTIELALFLERCRATIVGVTGTKGKSTTSTLLHLMLQTRRKTWLGGNIGGSLLESLDQIDAEDLVVLELSSYMLEYLRPTRWSPHGALVTMLGEDHLDWHGSAAAYINAKRNIVRFQTAGDFAIISEDAPDLAGWREAAGGDLTTYSIDRSRPFVLALPGQHNQLNAQAAFAAAARLGVTWQQAQGAIAGFAGLPHRMQLIAQRNGVDYYDDSIATIPAAAAAALQAFPRRRVIQIVGGSDKGLPIEPFCAALANHSKAALCIGSTGPAVASMLRMRTPPAIAVYECHTLAKAVEIAAGLAVAGDVVLLSPGFASYDQYINFEQRGDQFSQHVRSLPVTAP